MKKTTISEDIVGYAIMTVVLLVLLWLGTRRPALNAGEVDGTAAKDYWRHLEQDPDYQP